MEVERRTPPYKIEETEEKILTQLACIALLERDYGWHCAISMFKGWAGMIHPGKDTYLACLVSIKKADEPFDIKKIAAPAIHPVMALLACQWKNTLSDDGAMGEEFLKCKRGWLGWRDIDCGEVLGCKDAIFVRYGLCGTGLISALPRLIKPVTAGIEAQGESKGWAPYGWLEILPCGDEIAYLRWGGDERGEFARYYIAEDVTVAYYDNEKRIKGNKTNDLLEEWIAWEMVK